MEESHKKARNKSKHTRKERPEKEPSGGRTGTKSSWDKLNQRLEPLALVNIDSGQIYWHASILAELRELKILDEEEAEQEDETTLDDPDGMEEDNQEHENERDHSDEDNDEPGHRRDENDEY